jgi:hypothetical protein
MIEVSFLFLLLLGFLLNYMSTQGAIYQKNEMVQEKARQKIEKNGENRSI